MTQTTTGGRAETDRSATVAQLASIMAEASAAADKKRAAAAKNAGTLAADIARNAARMRYLAMAVSCIADGSSPTGIDRENCVGYLLCTLEFLGRVTEEAADALERNVSGETA